MRVFILLIALLTVAEMSPASDFTTYINSAGDKTLRMNLRWSALIKAADAGGAAHLDQIRKFAGNSDWFMRNASLIALKKISKEAAVEEARKLILDKALVVRSAAVDVIAEDLNESNKKILIEEMDKPYNFNKRSSLWIRKQIVEKIAVSAESSDRNFFAKNLFDEDRKIAELSARTLEKITGQKVEEKGYIENWRKIARENKWL